jgi:hypothetical protein
MIQSGVLRLTAALLMLTALRAFAVPLPPLEKRFSGPDEILGVLSGYYEELKNPKCLVSVLDESLPKLLAKGYKVEALSLEARGTDNHRVYKVAFMFILKDPNYQDMEYYFHAGTGCPLVNCDQITGVPEICKE